MTSEKAAQPTLETILRPGQTVAGKYCVDHLIASGGMAAVWAGINLRTGKRVALKVILRSFASTPGAEELFRREALAASRVNHPNVVTVFDVVDHASRTCIVMEYLDGEDLGTYLQRQGLLSLEEAVALLLPAMRGVAAANAQGVVHRDLKPKNVFLCIGPDGRLVTTKILDFGISVIAEKASEPRTQTVQLTTHGTPSYMSPEHITGSPNIDERADVYGFGVILFEALAGQPPFAGPAGTELLMRILQEPAPKLTQFRPDLSQELGAIIEKALAKAPDARYPTLNHFIAALEDHALPRSPILRSLTPVVGVPIIDSGSGVRRLADPIVRVVRRDPSGEHSDGVTKALYVLSGKVAPRTEVPPSRLVPDRNPPNDGTSSREERAELQTAPGKPTEGSPPAARSTKLRAKPAFSSSDDDTASLVRIAQRRARTWQLLAVAVFVGTASVLVAWNVIPNHHVPTRVSEPQTSVPVTEQTAVGPPPSVPLPEKTLEPSNEEQPPKLDERTDDQGLPAMPGGIPRAGATRTVGRSMQGSASHSRRSREDRRSETVAPPTEMPSGPAPISPPPLEETGHRAGQLSTDDF